MGLGPGVAPLVPSPPALNSSRLALSNRILKPSCCLQVIIFYLWKILHCPKPLEPSKEGDAGHSITLKSPPKPFKESRNAGSWNFNRCCGREKADKVAPFAITFVIQNQWSWLMQVINKSVLKVGLNGVQNKIKVNSLAFKNRIKVSQIK